MVKSSIITVKSGKLLYPLDELVRHFATICACFLNVKKTAICKKTTLAGSMWTWSLSLKAYLYKNLHGSIK